MSRIILLVLTVLVLIGSVLPAQAEELRVRDIPVPEGATDVSYMKRRGDIRFQVPSDFKTAGNFYTKKLAEQKWAKSGKDNLQRNFWVQQFTKDKVSLEVRVDSRGEGSEVRLTPKGLMWDEDDQPTPKNLPLPKDAQELVYDDFFESIKFKSASNLKATVEFFTKELGERKWTKDATEVDVATFVRLKVTQAKSSLTIDIRAADTGSEIEIRTKGMQWDGMKTEIARARKRRRRSRRPRRKWRPTNPWNCPSERKGPSRASTNCRSFPAKALW